MSFRDALADPVVLRRINGWLTVFWMLNFPPIILLYLTLSSKSFAAFCLLYLALVSIWANVAGHASGWQSARVEVNQAEDANVQDVVDIITEKL